MAKAKDLIENARFCLNPITKYHDGAMLPGVGMDCVGLIIYSIKASGIEIEDKPRYESKKDKLPEIMEYASEFCEVIKDQNSLKLGDILMFRFRQMNHHFALFTGYLAGHSRMIHCYEGVGKVTEDYLDESWNIRFYCAFRIKGLEY